MKQYLSKIGYFVRQLHLKIVYEFNPKNVIRIEAFSDTHNNHSVIEIPNCDLLLFVGDCSENGTYSEISDFLNWIKTMPGTQKIIVPGNHDKYFEELLKNENQIAITEDVMMMSNSYFTYKGLCIGAFSFANRPNHWPIGKYDSFLSNHTIPALCFDSNIDILLTHFPPKGIRDRIMNNIRSRPGGLQCINEIIHKTNPKIHIFGHIHDSYGSHHTRQCIFYNVSIKKNRKSTTIFLKNISK